MSALFKEFFKYYKLANDYADKRTIEYPFIGSPIPVLAILGIYLLFVKRLGPAFMKNRQPLNIDRTIQIYNLVQILLCSYVGYKGSMAYLSGKVNFMCGEIDYSNTPEVRRDFLNPAYTYFILKLLDLFDTVFFVLRKKERQISFLHLYHHTMMVLVCWFGVRYVPGGHGVFLGTINSFVHVIMYAYYFITIYDKEYAKKNLWWKKHLTQLQMFQFGSLFVHAALTLFIPNCNYPRAIVYVLIPQNFFILVLFWDFYKKNYLSTKSKQ